jgi:hypothetical protein
MEMLLLFETKINDRDHNRGLGCGGLLLDPAWSPIKELYTYDIDVDLLGH